MTEAIPLMSGQRASDKKQLSVRQEITPWAPVPEDSEEEDKMLFAESKSRTTSLVISDMWILLCQLLQVRRLYGTLCRVESTCTDNAACLFKDCNICGVQCGTVYMGNSDMK